jgi:hypothetical protein
MLRSAQKRSATTSQWRIAPNSNGLSERFAVLSFDAMTARLAEARIASAVNVAACRVHPQLRPA